jgi:hypothetical protein
VRIEQGRGLEPANHHAAQKPLSSPPPIGVIVGDWPKAQKSALQLPIAIQASQTLSVTIAISSP